MHFRNVTFAVALALGALATGCTHSASTPTPIVVTPDASGIVVSGRGEIDVVPNMAVVSIGVEAHGKTVAEARDRAADAATRLHESLASSGIAKTDIKTTDLSIQPQYEYPPDRGPIAVGYTVSNTVSVKIKDLKKVSQTVDDAVMAGGDAVRVNGLSFEVIEADALRDQARAKAVKEARAKAEQLAELSGVELGAAISVEEVSFSMPMVPGRFESADMKNMPIEPGTASVSVDVRVRWSIGGS
jgi:uncharacterized protein YggE